MTAPRNLCYQPAQFGDLEQTQFIVAGSPGGTEDVALMAAVVQHRIAVGIRRYLKTQGLTQRTYASQLNMSSDRLTRILRGYKPMTLADIAVAYSVIQDRSVLPPIDTDKWVTAATAAARGSTHAQQSTEPNWLTISGRKIRRDSIRKPDSNANISRDQ